MPTIAEVRAQFPQYQDMPDSALADALHRKFYSDMPRADFDAKIGLGQALGAQPQPATFDERFVDPPRPENAQAMEKGLQEAAPVARGSFLPLSKNTRTGEVFFDTNAGIAKTVKDVLKLPGEVYSGETRLPSKDARVPGSIAPDEPGADEATRRVLEMAVTTSPISAASRATGSSSVAGTSRIKEIADLKDAANTAYKIADDAGFVVAQPKYNNFVRDVFSSAAKDGLDPTLHPSATAAFRRIEELRRIDGVSLQTLETMRRVLKDAASSSSPGERRIAMRMVDKLDDFVRGIKVEDVSATAQDPAVATKALNEARGLWSKVKKAEDIEVLIERAGNRAQQFSGSGYENAIRTEFRQLAQNQKKMRMFSEPEREAIRHVARGGPVDNLLRMIGKFAPTGVVSTALSGGAGAAVGGPIGAVALPTAGYIARNAATRATERNVNALQDLILNTPQAVNPLIGMSRQALDDVVRRSFMVGEGNLSASRR